MPKKNIVLNSEESKKGIFIPNFKLDESSSLIIQNLGISWEMFYLSHAFTFIVCVIMAQIRSRAMTAGIKDIQDIQKLESQKFFSKLLANHELSETLPLIYSLNKILPYLEEENLQDLPRIQNLILEKGGKASTQMSSNSIEASLENKIAFAKGNFRSFVGKIQTLPIYNPTSFGRYSDMTLGTLLTNITGKEFISSEEIKENFQNLFLANHRFEDNVSLNTKFDNLVPMESSLGLTYGRTSNLMAKSVFKTNENEPNLSPLEKVRRQRRNALYKKKK